MRVAARAGCKLGRQKALSAQLDGRAPLRSCSCSRRRRRRRRRRSRRSRSRRSRSGSSTVCAAAYLPQPSVWAGRALGSSTRSRCPLSGCFGCMGRKGRVVICTGGKCSAAELLPFLSHLNRGGGAGQPCVSADCSRSAELLELLFCSQPHGAARRLYGGNRCLMRLLSCCGCCGCIGGTTSSRGSGGRRTR